jgi:predicted DNA-binding transcriptional regulator AlpA
MTRVRQVYTERETVEQPDRLLTSKQVAEEINFPIATLNYWRSIGKGPAYIKIDRWVRYRQSAIAEWIDDQNPDA